jgi:hypothetical protein
MACVLVADNNHPCQQILRDLYLVPKGKAGYSSKQGVYAYRIVQIVPTEGPPYTVIYLPLYLARQRGWHVPLAYPHVAHQFTGTLRSTNTAGGSQLAVTEEAKRLLHTQGSVVVAADPSFGKSIVGAYLACSTGLRTAVLVNRLILAEQQATTYRQSTSAKVAVYGDDDEETCAQATVLICMSTRVPKMDVNLLATFGCLIVDEMHLLCNPTGVQAILQFTPHYVVLETATPKPSNGLGTILDYIAGPARVEGKAGVVTALYLCPTGIKGTRQYRSDGTLDWSTLETSLVENEERNAYALAVVHHQLQRGKKPLVVTKRIEHAKRLAADIPGSDYLAGAKGSYSNGSVLIVTIPKGGTGLDQELSCPDYHTDKRPFDVVIVVCSIADVNILTQVFGRGFRSVELEIWYLVDDDPTIRKHWRTATKWATNRGAEILEWCPPPAQEL